MKLVSLESTKSSFDSRKLQTFLKSGHNWDFNKEVLYMKNIQTDDN